MQEKSRYTLQELFDDLPISLRQLGIKASVSEVTVARIRDGEAAQRSTVNRLLKAMSEVYGRQISLANVTGVNLRKATKTVGGEVTDENLPDVA